MPEFTYDPSKITENGLDQMRFELGDTVVDMGALASPLCDEEYNAILAKYGENWRTAKLKCLEAIVMKLSYEVNTSVDGLSYSLDQRFERWKKMLEEAKQEARAIHGVPIPSGCGECGNGGKRYFHHGMHTNFRKF